MKSNLWVTWLEYPTPDEVEAEVISILGPPLNHMHNRDHPNWAALERARGAWRSWTPSQASSGASD
jgi:hypothetical protein